MTLPGMVTGRCRGWDSSAPSSRPPPTNLSWTSSLVRTCRTMRVATQIGEARQLEGCSGLDPITDAPVRLRDGLTGNGSDAAPNMKNFGKHIKTASSDPPHERSPTLLANHSDTQRRGPLPLPHRHPPHPPPRTSKRFIFPRSPAFVLAGLSVSLGVGSVSPYCPYPEITSPSNFVVPFSIDITPNYATGRKCRP